MLDPRNDALVEAVHNVAAAGVIPVISAGNDRDDFGLGSVGAPGTAPDAISVAAVSNAHVFMPILTVLAPGGIARIAVNGGPNATPPAWGTNDQKLVDVGTIVGTDGKPVDRRLCGPPNDLEALASTLPTGSLTGAIALVSRGYCTFASKVGRAKAAGAAGVVFVDNRPGEAEWPGNSVKLGLPAVMIADVDGAKLRTASAATGGRATVRVGRDPLEVQTGRGGTPMAFSSAGLTPFGHDLKPDVAAPGGAILSSTLKETVGEPFAVFDGTSMAAPHVSGAAALLLERHPNWSAAQLKSALMSTAGPAWGDTARTTEASVLLEGAGLIDVGRADAPLVFTDPQSLSFHYLNVNHGPASRPLLATISDAGNGYGTWQVELQAQSATAGAMLDLPPQITLSAGGGHAADRRRAGVGKRRRRRRLRLHRPAQGRHDAPDPVRVHGRAAWTGVGLARKARELPGRGHPLGRRQGERLPLADRSLRPGGELQRPARRRERRGEALRHRPQPAGGQHRRRRRRPVRQLADRPVVPRLARRERRHGLPGHAGERELVPLRLPGRRRRPRDSSTPSRASTTSRSTPGTASSPTARSRGGTSCTPGSTTSTRRWRS